MILEREQWHLGYASLLRDCRSATSSTNNTNNNNTANLDSNNVTIGRALLLVHPDSTDALATARILSYMLRADGVPYQIRPCLGLERLKLILRSVGVISPNNGDNNGEEEFEGNIIEQHDTNNDGGGSVNDVRAVVLINMGANRNLSKLFTTNNNNNNDHNATTTNNNNNIRAYVFDNHRPYHLANIHTGKNVVLFNDRPLDVDEIVSDGDNLSGDESSTSSEESDDDDSDSDEGKGEESSDGEEEFELDQDGEDGNAAAESGGSGVRGGEEGDLVDSDDDDDDDSDNNGREMKRQKRDNDGVNPLDTTAATADLTMTTTQGEEDEDDDNNLDQEDATQQQQQQPVISLRDLHRQRRNRIRLHYSSGSYHASPSSWTAYTLCTQLRFGDTPDLLWLACVGVTDASHGECGIQHNNQPIYLCILIVERSSDKISNNKCILSTSLYTIHSSLNQLSIHTFSCCSRIMDWSSVLESSRQALSIDGTIKTKYQCFVNRFNSVGG